MHLWPGSCYAHIQFTARSLEKVRTLYPNAPLVAHPECLEAVRDMADEVCSTEKMVSFCKNNKADTFIIVTESGMITRLRREIPDKTFVAGPTEHCACSECKYMKMNTVEKLLACMKNRSPEIVLPEDIREKALVPIQRMLEWSR